MKSIFVILTLVCAIAAVFFTVEMNNIPLHHSAEQVIVASLLVMIAWCGSLVGIYRVIAD